MTSEQPVAGIQIYFKGVAEGKLKLNDSLQKTNSFKKQVKQMESDIGLIEQLNPNLRRKR